MDMQPMNLAISAQRNGILGESDRHTLAADEDAEKDKTINSVSACVRQKLPIGFSIADHFRLTNEQLGGLKDSEEIIRSHIALLNDVEANLRGERIRLTGVLQQQHEMHLQLGGTEDAVESTNVIPNTLRSIDYRDMTFDPAQLKRCADRTFKSHGGTEGDDSGECSEFDECDDSIDGRLYFGGQSILQNFHRFAAAAAAAKNINCNNNNNNNNSSNNNNNSSNGGGGSSNFLHQFTNAQICHLPQDAPVDLSINSRDKDSAGMIPPMTSFGNYFPLILPDNNNFQQQSRRPMPPTTEDPLEQFMSVNDNQNIKWREMYDRHSRTNPPNRCGECQKDLSCKSALIMHYRTHTEERPYICKICQKSFTTKGNLKTHLGVHRELLPLLRNLNRPDHHSPFVIGNQCNLSPKQLSPKPMISMEETQVSPTTVSTSIDRSFMQSVPVQVPATDAGATQNDSSFSSFNAFRHFPTAFPLALMEQNSLTHMLNQLQQQQQQHQQQQQQQQQEPSSVQNKKPAHLASLQLPMLPMPSFPSQHISMESELMSAGSNIGEDLRVTCRSADLTASFKPAVDNSCKYNDNDRLSPTMDESNSSMTVDEINQQHQGICSVTTTPILEGTSSEREARTTCRVCGKVCSCRSALQIHMRTHTKEKPFLCVVCGKAFSTKGNMRQHESTHKRGSMLYNSVDNGAYLDADSSLFSTSAERVAIASLPQGAIVFENSFENQSARPVATTSATTTTEPSEQTSALYNDTNLSSTVSPSIENVDIPNDSTSAADFTLSNFCVTDTSTDSCNGFHKQRRICEVCNKECPTKSSLDIHMRSHTGEKPYSCPRCTKRFSTMGNMQAHLKRHCPETRAADERAAAAICPQSQLYSLSRAVEESLLNSTVSSAMSAMSAGCLPSGFHANLLNAFPRGGLFPGFLPAAPRDLLAPPNCWPALFPSQIGMPFNSYGLPPPNLSAQEHLRQSFLNEEELLDEDESMEEEDGEEIMSDVNFEVNGNSQQNFEKVLPVTTSTASCIIDSASMNTMVS